MTKWDVMSFIFRDAIMYFSLDRFDIRAGVIALVPPDLAPGELCSDGNGLGMGAVVVKRDWDRNGQPEADPSQAISIWRSSLHWQHRVTLSALAKRRRQRQPPSLHRQCQGKVISPMIACINRLNYL